MQSANTVESGDNPTGSESSQTMSLSETKEESGAAKKSESGAAEKSEKESNSSSSQQNSVVPTVVPSLQESSTEELLKILEEGNLSEVSTVFRTSTFNPKAQFLELQPKGLNLTPRQVYLHFNPKV